MSNQTLTRKEFMKLGFAKTVLGITELLPGNKSKVLNNKTNFVRPPGAIEEKDFLNKCTKCSECIKSCPHLVIKKAGYEFGYQMEGTPIILAEENPCLFCEDFPCINSCETGALQLSDKLRIGIASIDKEKCYLTNSQPCDYCYQYCNIKPRAVIINEIECKVDIDETLCNGCGRCAEICPANAIKIYDHRISA